MIPSMKIDCGKYFGCRLPIGGVIAGNGAICRFRRRNRFVITQDTGAAFIAVP
jgi:hypothetical protein